MSYQLTFWDIPNATFLQELEFGAMPLDKQAGQMTEKCGQEAALASLSARQAKELGLLTSGTYGQRSSISFVSVALSRCLASRLRQKTDLLGSTLWRLTWKERTTPQGRLIPALRASVLRTSDKDFIGWPTLNASPQGPRAMDLITESGRIKRRTSGQIRAMDIQTAAMLTGWPTPQVIDASGQGRAGRLKKDGNRNTNLMGSYRIDLKDSVLLTGWTTPSARDWRDTVGMTAQRKDGRSRLDQLPRQANLASWPTPCANKTSKSSKDPVKMKEGGCQSCLTDAAWLTQASTPARLTASGEMLTGFSAEMENGGQLNPSLSRWLIGLPIAWDIAALEIDILLIRSKKKRKTE